MFYFCHNICNLPYYKKMKKIILTLLFSLSNLIYCQVDEQILHYNFITSVNTWNGEEQHLSFNKF